ncbi:MAG: Wzz/FepE/Etk N-terminal domain-containing protein [Acidobacteriota bacterium]|nr:Wzz/FepE/Etk N-terminal domain-containing protein [Acidobacteriota bacterium]
MSKAQSNLQSTWEEEIEESRPAKPLSEHAAGIVRQLAVLWHAKGLVAGITLAMALLALALSFIVHTTFQADAAMMPPDSSPVSGLSMLISMKTGLAGGGLSSQFGDMLGMRSPGELCIRQMGSLPVREKLVQRFDLLHVYKVKTLDAAVRVLKGSTKMEEDRKSGVITVSVVDQDPKRAAALANAYTEEYGSLIEDMNAATGRRERQYFEHELANARVSLAESTRKLAEFTAQHGMVDPASQGQMLMGSTASLQAQISATETLIQSQSPILGDQNVRMQGLRSRLEELKRQLAKVQGNIPAQGSVDSGGGNTAQAGPSSLGRMAGLTIPYTELFRDFKVDEAMVETLTQQYEITRLEETHRVSSVQVLEPAEVPLKKFGPHRSQYVLGGLLLGFLVSCIYAYGRNWWRHTGDDDPWKRLLKCGPENGPETQA